VRPTHPVSSLIRTLLILDTGEGSANDYQRTTQLQNCIAPWHSPAQRQQICMEGRLGSPEVRGGLDGRWSLLDPDARRSGGGGLRNRRDRPNDRVADRYELVACPSPRSSRSARSSAAESVGSSRADRRRSDASRRRAFTRTPLRPLNLPRMADFEGISLQTQGLLTSGALLFLRESPDADAKALLDDGVEVEIRHGVRAVVARNVPGSGHDQVADASVELAIVAWTFSR
jgi:hypothetical protein